jgi:hypothetical protein
MEPWTPQAPFPARRSSTSSTRRAAHPPPRPSPPPRGPCSRVVRRAGSEEEAQQTAGNRIRQRRRSRRARAHPPAPPILPPAPSTPSLLPLMLPPLRAAALSGLPRARPGRISDCGRHPAAFLPAGGHRRCLPRVECGGSPHRAATLALTAASAAASQQHVREHLRQLAALAAAPKHIPTTRLAPFWGPLPRAAPPSLSAARRPSGCLSKEHISRCRPPPRAPPPPPSTHTHTPCPPATLCSAAAFTA